jgi:hypothetical protein
MSILLKIPRIYKTSNSRHQPAICLPTYILIFSPCSKDPLVYQLKGDIGTTDHIADHRLKKVLDAKLGIHI